MQGRLSATPSATAPPGPFFAAENVDEGGDSEGNALFVESAAVTALIALMPQAITALSDQARIGEDGERVNGCSPVLLASGVDVATFNALLSSETRPGASLSFDALSGSVHIYELPKDGHDVVAREFVESFALYNRGQGSRRVPGTRQDFLSLGATEVSLGPHGDRQRDESVRAITNVHIEPVLVVEISNAQTLAQGDARAQAWLLCPHLGMRVQGVLVVKYWPRRMDGTFAAVAALYEQGGGPGVVARTVNLVDPAAAAPQVYVPGVPPAPGIQVAAGAAQLPVGQAPLVAVLIALTPIAPTRVVSFDSGPPWAGAALDEVRGLGTAPEGVGFPGAGHCNGAPCGATGVIGYALRLPAARLYFGVPSGPLLPAGFQPNPLVLDDLNDFRLHLYGFSFVLNLSL